MTLLSVSDLRGMTTRKRARAAVLYAKHKSVRKVARRMGISASTVCQHIEGASVDLSVSLQREVDVMRLVKPNLN